MKIPFNKPYLTGNEIKYISEAHALRQLAGDGYFTKICHEWLENNTNSPRGLLTHSCTAALEMAAILLDLEPGQEIIMPSYTFVSTANAFVLRGAIPVFVDISNETLCLDERIVENAITSRTRAIVPVHYAGVSCNMDYLLNVAEIHDLPIIEDAAQAVMSTYNGRALGALGDLGCLSFHETKNIISGEGGALLINDPKLIERAEIIREKGTNRAKYFKGQVDKYTWVDIGSSYLPGEIVAGFLWAQIQESQNITNKRLSIWRLYHEAFKELEERGCFKRPSITKGCLHNAHMYYLILKDLPTRSAFINKMKSFHIDTPFHYVPLHSSPYGKKYCKTYGTLSNTDNISETLVRLPLWIGMEESGAVDKVIDSVISFFS